MRKTEEIKGITLIALVVTIIVLLILAGISITMLTGENGILGRTREAKVETKKSEYKEALGLIGSDVRVEKEIEGLENKQVLDEYEDEIQKDGLFENSILERVSDTELQVETKEGYLYQITEKEVEYLKQVEQEETSGGTGVSMQIDPATWAKKTTVTLKLPTEEEGKVLYYSKNGGRNWYKYTAPFEIKENNIVIQTKIGKNGEIETMQKIETIDNLPPEKVTITTDKDVTEKTITVVTEAKDEEADSINGTSSIVKYYFSKDGGVTWEPAEGQSEDYYTFSGLTEGETYKIVVKAEDGAGNSKESTEEKVTLKN